MKEKGKEKIHSEYGKMNDKAPLAGYRRQCSTNDQDRSIPTFLLWTMWFLHVCIY